jgi:protein-S-isoprenylcysteine O-methyltransferase Ste14
MKTCMDCGTVSPRDTVACDKCGYKFRFAEGGAETTDAAVANETQRPTGDTPKLVGGVLFVAGLLSFLFSFAVSVTSYDGSLDAKALAWKWLLTWTGAGMLHLGLLIWLVGYIVHAISFLPGKDEQ